MASVFVLCVDLWGWVLIMKVETNQVLLGVKVASKDELLEKLAQKGVELGFADDEEKLLKAFQDREAAGATGFVDGFAIPHAKSTDIKKSGVVVVRLAEPVAWPSYDHGDASTVIALYIREREAGTAHLSLLSRSVTMIMSDSKRERIVSATTPEELAAAVSEGLE